MNSVIIELCEAIPIKIKFPQKLSNAVDFFFAGFDKKDINASHMHIIEILTISDNQNTECKPIIFRNNDKNFFECLLYNSRGIYNKKTRTGTIEISEKDIISTTGKHNYNMLYFIITEIITRILLQEGFVAYHASAISINDSAVIFMGESTAGKTTLSLLLSKKGLKYFGDDRIFIKNGYVYGYPKPLHISHDVKNLLDENNIVSNNRRGKSFVPFAKYIKAGLSTRNKIRTIVVLNKKDEEPTMTMVKEKIGLIYSLNSLFYCDSETPILLDSILSLENIPLYLTKNYYTSEWINSLYNKLS